MENKAKSKTLINRKKLHAMIPLAERTIYNMEQRGEFPRRWGMRKAGSSSSCWTKKSG